VHNKEEEDAAYAAGYRFVASLRRMWEEGADKRRESLLHQPNEPLPEGCYCQPGRCMAPVIMGRQTPCRDPIKAALREALPKPE
jgi:hypothetical protein